ncbi:MAG: hypothetical protein V4714_19675 [Bacteroidota bacterium]
MTDVFNQKEMTWYGLDFSLAKFVGDFESAQVENITGIPSIVNPENATQIRDKYFKSWNYVIEDEKEKYDLPTFFKKESVIYDLSAVEAVNLQVNPDSMMVTEAPKELSKNEIQGAIRKYKAKSFTGLGLVFLVESFNKISNIACIDLVFFDIASGDVLFAKRCKAKPAGFGLRNYWVRSALEVMILSKKSWKFWEKEARNKK